MYFLMREKVTSLINHAGQPITYVTTEFILSSEFSIILHVSNLKNFSYVSLFL